MTVVPGTDKDAPRETDEEKQVTSITLDGNDGANGKSNGDPNGSKPKAKVRSSKKSLLVVGLASLAVIGLAVGLGVGLSKRSDDGDGSDSSNDTAGAGMGIGSLSTTSLYTSSQSDAVPYRLQSFGENVLQGYEDCADLKEDLGQAFAYLANVIIMQNAEYGNIPYPVYEDVAAEDGAADMEMAEESQMDGQPPPGASAPAGDGSAAKEPAGGEDAYETNTQVEGVDEADVVKSDGESVFAAYGDRIVHFDKLGNKISETKMPAPYYDDEACKSSNYDGGVHPEPMPTPAEDGVGHGGTETVTVSVSMPVPGQEEAEEIIVEEDNGGQDRHPTLRRRKTLSIAPDYWPCYRPEARIEALLLENDRLVVVVSGYGQGPSPHREYDQPILGNAGTTKVRVYDTKSFVDNTSNPDATLPELELIGSRDLPGYYAQKGGRSIGSKAYLVSHNDVDTYYHFRRHFDRWQIIYDGLSDEEYTETAAQYAKGKVIPNFVDRLMAEIIEDGEGSCEHITQVAMFQTGNVSDRTHHWWDNGVFNGLTQVTSIDLSVPAVQAESGEEPLLAAEKSVAFVPSTWGTTVYASRDMLFLATEGYDEHPLSRSGFVQATFLYGFELDGEGPARAATVGKVPGTVLNQFSIDEHQGFLRVATTTWASWICTSDDTGLTPDGDPDTASNVASIEESAADEPELITEPDIDEPVFCEDNRRRGPSNQITILSTSSGEIMEQVGYLGGLGKPGENIYAVRFVGDKGFVVTFLRTDPFYTLDLSVPTDPQIVGELEIPGFSNYLHPTEDPDVFIAVGEDADEMGRVLGLQVSLFSVKNFGRPEQLARYNIESSDDAYSSSETQWDHRAFRYLRESKLVILPAEVRVYDKYSSGEFFDGFYIFKIEESDSTQERTITLQHRINMAPKEDEMYTRCYYNARLGARSMVFDGNVMLFKNHAVESHDLHAEKGQSFIWRLDMDESVTEEELAMDERCYYWW